jgi:hypothetical protein
MRVAIEEYLFQNGFIRDEDVYTKVAQKKVGEMIINGQRQIQTQSVEIAITFIGEGWIGEDENNSEPTTQWNLSVNGVDQGDFIVENADEFKQIFKS